MDRRLRRRTGAEYPPNQRLVEFEKSLDDEPYTRVRKLHLLEKDYEEVEKLREEGDEGDGDGEPRGLRRRRIGEREG